MAAVVTPGTPASMKTKIPLLFNTHRSKRLKAKQQQTVQTEDVIRERHWEDDEIKPSIMANVNQLLSDFNLKLQIQTEEEMAK